MHNFQGRRRLKKMVYSKLTIICLLVLVLLLSRALWRVYQKNEIAIAEVRKSESKFLELEKQKEDLEGKVKWLSTLRGQEEAIRQNFSVLKEGEKVILVVDPKEATSTDFKNAAKPSVLEKIKTIINNWW